MTAPLDRLAAALADRYRIERELGAGGMATVYLAEDLKHHRRVAIKVLKPELAAVLGADRFVHEITTTAQLQHPHILPLFDSGQAGGFLYYVMPYIEGETLRDKLTRETQLPIPEAVRISSEVADALDYAHRRGVIHRDIKPENILLHDGRPMVADFGIALALSAAAGGRMTETGMSLGTPHYMSPEQATADKEITGRSDIYSLGTVLYEMLAGEPPHMGNSAQQIVMKILTEDAPPVTKLRKAVPPNVAAAVATALEKLPADRFETARAFAGALADAHYVGSGRTAAGGTPARPAAGRKLLWALTSVLLAAATLALGLSLRGVPPGALTRYALAFPAAETPNSDAFAVITPDGSRIIYSGSAAHPGARQLWAKLRDQVDPVPIPGTEDASAAAVSPDGKWLAVVQADSLWKMPIGGGPRTSLAGGVSNAVGVVAWLDDGTLVYADQAIHLMRVPEGGGPPSVLWADSEATFNPMPLPGGRVLFTRCVLPCGAATSLWAVDVKTRRAHQVTDDGRLGIYVGHGVLVYLHSDGTALASRFDLGTLTLRGDAVVVADSISWRPIIKPYVAVSGSGTLVMEQSGNLGQLPSQLVWVDRDGRETPVDTSWTFQTTVFAGDEGMALSPDGTRLAVGVHVPAGDGVWLKSLPRGPLSRVSFGQVAFRPRWPPVAGWISYLTDSGVVLHHTDGTGTDSILRRGGFDEAQIAPDGKWLVVRSGAVGPVSGGRDIYGIRLGGDTSLVPLIATRFDEMALAISPDGHWIAYQSDETGQLEVFIRPFPGTAAGKWQVSNGGGTGPLWSRNGRELFYVRSPDSTMMAVPIAAGSGTMTLGAARRLFKLSPGLAASGSRFYTPWDVAPDGRFIMTRAVGSADQARLPLVVVENWVDDVVRKVKGR